MAAVSLAPKQDNHDFSSFYQECDSAPRINELAKWFESTAGEKSGQPIKNPRVDRRYLKPDDDELNRFIDLFEQRRGPFVHHYHASIPYRIEENCRLGHAILKYSKGLSHPLLYRSVGTGDGSLARPVAEFSQGRVETLCCSPNSASKSNFVLHGEPPHATFFHGPFHHLRDDVVKSREELVKFSSGFDIIHEDTMFQMYSPNRAEQVAFMAQSLKRDGIFIFVEKLQHASIDEYERREQQKDYGFKTRYFSQTDVAAKGRDVLMTMIRNQVTLDEMATVLKGHFKYCYVTWNSGNFYTIVASNSRGNLDQFVAHLGEPAIPNEFVYEETLPRSLY